MRIHSIPLLPECMVWLAVGFLMVVWPSIISYHETAERLRALIQRGEMTQGTFLQEKDHGEIAYHFTAQDREYYGISSEAGHRPESLAAGEYFGVHYDPRNPSNNMVQDPVHELETLRPALITADTAFLGMLAIIIGQLGRLIRTSLSQAKGIRYV